MPPGIGVVTQLEYAASPAEADLMTTLHFNKGEMLAALAEGRPPATAGRDNLDSIRIALAAIASAESGRTVALAGISAPAPPGAHPSPGE